jgi:hypothetical protein
MLTCVWRFFLPRDPAQAESFLRRLDEDYTAIRRLMLILAERHQFFIHQRIVQILWNYLVPLAGDPQWQPLVTKIYNIIAYRCYYPMLVGITSNHPGKAAARDFLMTLPLVMALSDIRESYLLDDGSTVWYQVGARSLTAAQLPLALSPGSPQDGTIQVSVTHYWSLNSATIDLMESRGQFDDYIAILTLALEEPEEFAANYSRSQQAGLRVAQNVRFESLARIGQSPTSLAPLIEQGLPSLVLDKLTKSIERWQELSPKNQNTYTVSGQMVYERFTEAVLMTLLMIERGVITAQDLTNLAMIPRLYAYATTHPSAKLRF